MSRLTSSPFHKPSPFEFPRGPPSPPDTNTDTVVGSGHILPAANFLLAQESGSLDGGIQGMHDTPLRPKKSSSIPYHNTNFRETKERATHRSINKLLILVIPPSTLLQDHVQQGQGISNGPFHRLTQGVVMPLLPSIFGQLTAIAREFNFPSTLGLCLYLHHVEDGLVLTPRISDDSWQSIWGHLSDPPLPNERRPLICGKIEFDIDLRAARWYSSWASALYREMNDYPGHAYPATAPSHFRGDSSVVGTRPFEDDSGDNAIQQNSAPIGRHIPKKLSLVERFDIASVRSDHRHQSRSVAASTEVITGQQVLSTILQEDEPQSGRQQLDNLVKSWRASALLNPSPLAAKGQTSLDAANLPNDMPIDTPDEIPSSPALMKLEDFTWSVSSSGPLSHGELSPVSWSRTPSVHLAHRLQGSVCTSPSTCTSFNFVDDDNFSYASTEYRLPSVHLAERLQGSVCSSPMTCTSFGPDDDDHNFPYTSFFSRVPTPDIAQRLYEDCPPTPLTATSWGAPLSYPPSPRCDSPTISVDLGERTRFDDQFETTVHYPRFGPSEDSMLGPWRHVWPFNNERDSGISLSSEPSVEPWKHVWPFTAQIEDGTALSSTHMSGPWQHVWPFNNDNKGIVTSTSLPIEKPWEHVWPYNSENTRTAQHIRRLSQEMIIPTSGPGQSSTSNARPWLNVWPYNSLSISSELQRGSLTDECRSFTSSERTKLDVSSFGYPYINIYRPVYPHLEIYPTRPGELSMSKDSDPIQNIVVGLPASYPIIQLYEPVYPYTVSSIYPEIPLQSLEPCGLSDSEYHHLEKCLEVVNKSETSAVPATSGRTLHTTLPGRYPTFNLYPAVYPFFDIYPCVHTPQTEDLLSVTCTMSTSTLSPTLLTAYPSFNLYPPIYPFFDIYPAPYGTVDAVTVVEQTSGYNLSLSPILSALYPSFNIYPSLYPYLEIYPAPYGSVDTTSIKKEREMASSLSPLLPPMYPSFNLYPNIYPYIEIYPSSYNFTVVSGKIDVVGLQGTAAGGTGYPYFNLYPGVYPHLNIYPTPYVCDCLYPSPSESSNERLAQKFEYPHFNLYPAVYPNFDLYPPLPEVVVHQPKKTSKVSNSRLTHLELHAMVMMEKTQAMSKKGSVGLLNSFLDMPDIGRNKTSIHEDEEIDRYLHKRSISNATRIDRISTAPIQSRDFDKTRSISTYKTGSAFSLDSMPEKDQDPPVLYETSLHESEHTPSRLSNIRERLGYQEESSPHRKSLNIHGYNLTRSSSFRESDGKLPIPPKPLNPITTRRRDSLVLQRVKALDSNVTENPSSISRETLLRFPMPPRTFPPLPLLPQDRGH